MCRARDFIKAQLPSLGALLDTSTIFDEIEIICGVLCRDESRSRKTPEFESCAALTALSDIHRPVVSVGDFFDDGKT